MVHPNGASPDLLVQRNRLKQLLSEGVENGIVKPDK